MQLNAKQQEAVNHMDSALLVLAGPGTGKTQLLSSKVAHILEVEDTNPENILCVTFTEAGASNMQERLLSIIGPDANKVNVYTYHSFGSNILAQYKNYSSDYFRTFDEPIDTVTQYKIISSILESLPQTDPLKSNNAKDVIQTISEAKNAELNSKALEKIAEQNVKDSIQISKKLSDELKNVVPRKVEPNLEVYGNVTKILTNFIHEEPIVGRIEYLANEMLRSLYDALYKAENGPKPSVKPLTNWKSSYFEKDSSNNYRLKNYLANKKLQSLANVMKAYEDYLNENNLFDYSDMINQAVSILKTDDGFRLTLQEHYQYILLDEFQDTNPAQFSLIRELTDKENTYIMAVGDDDQAIYEFQGASASNLLDFRNEFDAYVVNLSENYRSTTEIVNFAHRISDQIEDSFAKNYKYDKILTSARNDEILNGETGPHISREEFVSSDAEYSWISDQIKSLIETGEDPNNIAIITPKHKFISPLLPYLKDRKIDVSYEKRENIFEDPRINELTTLAHFVYDVANGKNPNSKLLEILSFPFFEIPAVDAISTMSTNYKDQRTSFEFLLNSKSEKIKKVGELLAELVVKSFETPLELFLDYLIGKVEIKKGLKSPFLDFYSKAENSFKTYNLYENLLVLREHLKNHTKVDHPRLKDFIDFLDDYEVAGEAILNTSPYQDSSNSVQIMTAHSSKGLEFKYVFLVCVDDYAWGNSKGNNNLLSLPKNLSSIRHTGATEDECIRLFFVAVTRAEKNLIMTNSRENYLERYPKRLQYLAEYEEGNKIRSPLLEDDKKATVNFHSTPLNENERKEVVYNNWLSNYLELTPELKPYLEKRIENFRMTASILTSFIDINYGGPLSVYNTYILKGPKDPDSIDMKFGDLIHATFEKTTKEKLDKKAAEDYYNSEVEKLDLSDRDKSNLLERGKISISKTLENFSDIILPTSKAPKAEYDFSSEKLNYKGVPISGKIDHFNINEEDKTIELYDYKTGKFREEKWTSNATLYKYYLQLMFYRLLLKVSPSFQKYKVETGSILFVSPNADELAVSDLYGSDFVHEKILDFTDTDEAYFEKLLLSVYKHIKALDFIDKNSPLAVYPDENKSMKQMREFCDLIIKTAGEN